jgi:hypothetical protein
VPSIGGEIETKTLQATKSNDFTIKEEKNIRKRVSNRDIILRKVIDSMSKNIVNKIMRPDKKYRLKIRKSMSDEKKNEIDDYINSLTN